MIRTINVISSENIHLQMQIEKFKQENEQLKLIMVVLFLPFNMGYRLVAQILTTLICKRILQPHPVNRLRNKGTRPVNLRRRTLSKVNKETNVNVIL